MGKSTVNDIMAKYRWSNSLHDLPRSGRPRKTTVRVDRVIKRKSTADVHKTAAELCRELREEKIADISRSTVTRRLHEENLFGRIGSRKPLVSAKNRKARLEFARAHQHWTADDWRKVAFSDETKVNLFGNDGKSYIRRPKGQRDNIRYQTPTVKHGGGSVMLWGIFSGYGLGPIVKIEGKMNGVMYRKILEENLLQYAEDHMPLAIDRIFQHDPKHTSQVVKQWLSSEKIRVLKWPAQSPDLNPIELLWNVIKLRIRKKKISNKGQLYQILQEEWSKIPAQTINDLIESMPRRCQAVFKSQGFPNQVLNSNIKTRTKTYFYLVKYYVLFLAGNL